MAATVQNGLQKSMNEVSDWSDKNAMISHDEKKKREKSLLLATRETPAFPLILHLNLKDSYKKFLSTDTLALSSTMNSVGDPTLLAHAKQYKKKKTVPVVTAQTLPGKSYFIMLTFRLT